MSPTARRIEPERFEGRTQTATRRVFDVSSSFQKEAIKKLIELDKSLSWNWDSYGSPPPLRTVIELTKRVFSQVEDVSDLSVPQIFPVSGGGIQLEWCNDSRELEIEVLPDNKIEFLKTLNGEPVEEGSISSWPQIKTLIFWLLR